MVQWARDGFEGYSMRTVVVQWAKDGFERCSMRTVVVQWARDGFEGDICRAPALDGETEINVGANPKC